MTACEFDYSHLPNPMTPDFRSLRVRIILDSTENSYASSTNEKRHGFLPKQ